MPQTDWGWLITADELRSWIVHEDDGVLVVNKPGLVVCHPSKRGPWSSLIGAAREYLNVERLHMPSRLDRETSGVVVMAKNHELASRLQTAVLRGRTRKTYLAVLEGELRAPVVVDQPICKDPQARSFVRRWVVEGGQKAETEFIPIEHAGGKTLARVHPRTGRLHQIRVHAAWLGHAVAGDKLYGPDEALFLEFIGNGWTDRLAAALPLNRQALHAAEITFEVRGESVTYRAPLAADFEQFWNGLKLSTRGPS